MENRRPALGHLRAVACGDGRSSESVGSGPRTERTLTRRCQEPGARNGPQRSQRSVLRTPAGGPARSRASPPGPSRFSRCRADGGSGVTCSYSYSYINTARPAASPARGSTQKARRPCGPRRQLRRVRPSAKATKHAESRGRRDSFWSRDHRAADKSEPAARSRRGRERGHTRPPRPSLLFL